MNIALNRMQQDKGDYCRAGSSGGSTPKALRQYGVPESAYSNEEGMYKLVHDMRNRVMTSPPSPPNSSWESFCSKIP